MKYLSLCSGIEAFSEAVKDLPYKAVGFAENDKFPSAVLKHHYPNTPNLGDITNYGKWNIERPDVVVAGTPCQSFSVAGLRQGLKDPRGNLTLVFIGILNRFKPKWFIWENVPGVLSSNKGRDFHTFLEGLQEIGYSVSWRILDAQFFGVPQRRKRLYLVGHYSEKWQRPFQVLFEPESLLGDIKKGGSKGKKTTSEVRTDIVANDKRQAGVDFYDKQSISQYGTSKVASTLKARDYKDATDLIAIQGNLIGREKGGPEGVGASNKGKMYTLTKTDVHAVAYNNLMKVGDITEEVKVRKHEVDIDNLQQLLRTYKANSEKTNRQIAEELSIPMTKVEHWFRTDSSFAIPSEDIWFDLKKCLGIKDDKFDAQIMEFEYKEGVFESTQRVYDSLGKAPTLTATNTDVHAVVYENHPTDSRITALGEKANTVVARWGTGGNNMPIVYEAHAQDARYREQEVCPTIQARHANMTSTPIVQQQAVIRRLTPVEAERLQGFPDNYTDIPYNNKPNSPDGARYKALGNSMAVPVMQWIAKRLLKRNEEKQCQKQ